MFKENFYVRNALTGRAASANYSSDLSSAASFDEVFFVSALTAESISSSMPATPFLNSVTLRPSERITDGRRLPKRRKAIAAMMISWVGEPIMAKSSNDIIEPFD